VIKQPSLQCPACHHALGDSLVCKSCGARYPKVHGIPMLLPEELPADMRQSIKAWDKLYLAMGGPALEEMRQEYERDYMKDTLEQLLEFVNVRKQKRYLEIGSGPGFLGTALAKQGFQVSGVDCSAEALKTALRLYKKEKVKGFFFGGDLHHIPLQDNSIDFLYGGGVLEHFKDTQGAINELYRILAPGGVSFNTVPYLSMAALTYRQIWGNIPDAPVLKQIYEFIHLKLLGGRHMKFGYEKSFTAAKMIKLHKAAGFSNVRVGLFRVFLPFRYLPDFLKPVARKLTEQRLFWPMNKIIAIK
jgi:ubiquinone/menaquinone biosynthesis C-methylase UbiE/uncharacterized protein YbaR (Trm112 family)